ncbi:hypothetical protein EDB89DRAFT_107504 [Lactarius sanguifluus]|nr:hypothetical protein EDB89DRAFT_107504 [Lactarius sanguifluus]
MSLPGPATTINSLPDNVFVQIFSLCRMHEVGLAFRSYYPWKWRRLAHVCRTWRHIMFASSRYLRLEIYCTHGTPVKKKLGYLPTFPIVISYYDSRRLGAEQDNLFAALENRDRVRVIDLCRVPHTLFERLATVMQEPFTALTFLRLELTYGNPSPVISDTFLGGFAPRLETICISGFSFPGALTLLSSAHDLVQLSLSDIPPAGYIPPEAMVATLGALPRLESLNFKFELGTSYPDQIRPLPITRTVLPALTIFCFMGLFKYFEDFVAQIDTPQLNCLRIGYLEQEVTDFQIPQFCKFLSLSEKFKLSRFIHAEIFIMSPNVINIELDRCSQSSFYFSVQREAVGQVVSQISPMLSVDRLSIHSCIEHTGGGIPWLVLFYQFTSVKALSVHDDLSWNIHLALDDVTGDRAAEVLPALELLRLHGRHKPAKSMEGFAGKFVTARQNVGRPVTVVDEEEFEKRLDMLDAII